VVKDKNDEIEWMKLNNWTEKEAESSLSWYLK
jgi:hypothetical protein